MPKCKDCGKQIRFIKVAGKKPIPVNFQKDYFVPDEVGGSEIFVTLDGTVRKGRYNPDGMPGHRLHKCARRNEY